MSCSIIPRGTYTQTRTDTHKHRLCQTSKRTHTHTHRHTDTHKTDAGPGPSPLVVFEGSKVYPSQIKARHKFHPSFPSLCGRVTTSASGWSSVLSLSSPLLPFNCLSSVLSLALPLPLYFFSLHAFIFFLYIHLYWGGGKGET